MSFSGQVKEELVKCMASGKHCRLSELLAIKTFSTRDLEGEEFEKWEEFPKEIELSARKFFTLLKKTDNIRKEISALTDVQRLCCKRAFLRSEIYRFRRNRRSKLRFYLWGNLMTSHNY